MKYIVLPILEYTYRGFVFIFIGALYYCGLFVLLLWNFKVPSYIDFPFHRDVGWYYFNDTIYYTPLDFLLKRNRITD